MHRFPHLRTDPLGIPAAFGYFLVRQRSRINPPIQKSVKDFHQRHVVSAARLSCRLFEVLQNMFWIRWYIYFEVHIPFCLQVRSLIDQDPDL